MKTEFFWILKSPKMSLEGTLAIIDFKHRFGTAQEAQQFHDEGHCFPGSKPVFCSESRGYEANGAYTYSIAINPTEDLTIKVK